MKGHDEMKQEVMLRNHVTILGDGPRTILFVNGFGCDQSMWRFLTPELSREFRLILFDYVGTGKSDLSAYDLSKYKSLEGYVQDLLDVCVHLELKDVHIVAHSVGATIGWLASIRRPELFKNLILIGPSPCYMNDPPSYLGGYDLEDLFGLIDLMEKNYLGWAQSFSLNLINASVPSKLSGILETAFCSTDPLYVRKFAEATFFSDYRESLSKVTVSTYILQCSDDPIVPEQVGEYLHSHLKNSEFYRMNATGHCPHITHPEETLRLLRGFLM